jgi:hypothetical protein
MSRLRKIVAVVGLVVVVGLVAVPAGADVKAEASPSGQPALGLWGATVQWVAEWITAWTASGEPTDPEGALPLALDGSGGDQATTSGTDPNGGEISPGIDPNG